LVYLGHDMPSDTHYSGKIGYVRVNFGKGSYTDGKKFDGEDDDPFGFDTGKKKLDKKDDDEDDKKVKPDDDIIESTFDDNKPAKDDEHPNLKNLKEYGYGFWARFLTAYPKRLLSGKN